MLVISVVVFSSWGCANLRRVEKTTRGKNNNRYYQPRKSGFFVKIRPSWGSSGWDRKGKRLAIKGGQDGGEEPEGAISIPPPPTPLKFSGTKEA